MIANDTVKGVMEKLISEIHEVNEYLTYEILKLSRQMWISLVIILVIVNLANMWFIVYCRKVNEKRGVTSYIMSNTDLEEFKENQR